METRGNDNHLFVAALPPFPGFSVLPRITGFSVLPRITGFSVLQRLLTPYWFRRASLLLYERLRPSVSLFGGLSVANTFYNGFYHKSIEYYGDIRAIPDTTSYEMVCLSIGYSDIHMIVSTLFYLLVLVYHYFVSLSSGVTFCLNDNDYGLP